MKVDDRGSAANEGVVEDLDAHDVGAEHPGQP
jgi:hypothetical protein